MALNELHIAVLVIALMIIAILVFKNKGRKQLSPLAGLAFAFVIAGIAFGDDRLIGYGLMGVGIILAVIDIIKSRKK